MATAFSLKITPVKCSLYNRSLAYFSSKCITVFLACKVAPTCKQWSCCVVGRKGDLRIHGTRCYFQVF